MTNTKRIGKDSLGEVEIPADVYYGAQTQRAVLNFPVSGLRLPRRFIRAQGWIKASAARVHRELGELDPKYADAIETAAMEVADGKWDEQFVVDVYQAGAGTSQNMNANELIAGRALELLGMEKDRYDVIHPNDHVNRSQSTNDTIPTAMYMSTYVALKDDLLPALEQLCAELEQKAVQFDNVIKSGRTHLQDAVPIRLGQEFGGYAGLLRQRLTALNEQLPALTELGIGGNAVGTGVNSHPDYADNMLDQLSQRTGIRWKRPANIFSFMQNQAAILAVSGELRNTAVQLIKICSDLRLLSSGPRTGLAEIQLPAIQPGSSIMPGKVNPVVPEMMHMICCQVIGNDTVIEHAGCAGQLEINVTMPVVAHNILQSIEILANGMNILREKCVQGITANEEQCRHWMEQSLGLVTVLNPKIGYDKAAELAKKAVRENRSLKEVVLSEKVVDESVWDSLVLESVRKR